MSVDVKYNGYIVVAPSVVNGKTYKWFEGKSLLECSPPPIPLWLHPHVVNMAAKVQLGKNSLASITFIREPKTEERDLVLKALALIPADNYENWVSVGMALKSGGFDLADWEVWSNTSSKFQEGECAARWNSFKRNGVGLGTIFYYAKQHGFRFPAGYHEQNDIGNAGRLVERFGDVVRWYHSAKHWFCWDGMRWKKDEEEKILAYAKETAKAICCEAGECDDSDKRKLILKWANTSSSAKSLSAMLTVARPDLAITTEMLDRDQFKLNCLNGTIDLRNGKLTPHRKEDFITKMAPVEFDSDAKAPRFEQFLAEIFDQSTGLIDFVQCAVGSALTGSVKDQKLFLCHGAGQNGKSTLFAIIREVLGDYAQETDPNLLAAKQNNGGASEDVYRLRGVRLATTIEIDEDVKLNEAKTKQLTGGDRITARAMYGHFTEFDPTHKLFLIANHKPHIRSQGMAMWRRIKMIPFRVIIPEHKKDKDLLEKLRAERPGILAWLVRGCLKWLSEGLPEPPEVENATAEYKAAEDSLEKFIQDCCCVEPNAQEQAKPLRDRYKSWCSENGEVELSRTSFTNRMQEKGFTNKKTNTATMWMGLWLLSTKASSKLNV